MSENVQLSPAVVVHRASWIREQIRDSVCHLPARMETADLLQVALITLAHSVVNFDWEVSGHGASGEPAFVVHAKARLKVAMLNELRHMSHLGRLQRRRWLLLQLAREHVRGHRSNLKGVTGQEPSVQVLAALTGLSAAEVETLERVSQISDWPQEADIQLYFAQRAQRPVSQDDELQARSDTQIVMEEVGRIWAGFTDEQRHLLARHFGVALSADRHWIHRGVWRGRWQALLAPRFQWPWQCSPALRYRDRCQLGSAGFGLSDEKRVLNHHRQEVWPRSLQALLRPQGTSMGPGLSA